MLCDLCGRELPSPEYMRYSAAEFRAAITAGLRPPEEALRSREAAGMSREQMELAWVGQALASKTDWILCGSCGGTTAARLFVAVGRVGGGRGHVRSAAVTLWATFFAVAGVAPLLWTFAAFNTPWASSFVRWIFVVFALASGLLAWGTALTAWIRDDRAGVLAILHGVGMVVVLALLPHILESFSYGWPFFGGSAVYLLVAFGAALHLVVEL